MAYSCCFSQGRNRDFLQKNRFITLTTERIDRKHLVMIPEVVELKPDVHHLFSGQNFEAMYATNELLFCLK